MSESQVRPHRWPHAQDKLTDRQRKVINRLLDAGPDGFEGGVTTQKFASMTHCSRVTAYRELDQLQVMGILERVGQGRSVRYELKLHSSQANRIKYGCPWNLLKRFLLQVYSIEVQCS